MLAHFILLDVRHAKVKVTGCVDQRDRAVPSRDIKS